MQTPQSTGGDTTVHLSVLNGEGQAISGLQKDNFRVLVDNKPQTIAAFSEEKYELSIEVLVDSRTTGRGNRSGPSSASTFLNDVFKSRRHHAAITLFGKSSTLVQPSTDSLVALGTALKAIPAKAETPSGVYSQILLAANRLAVAPGRRVIFLVTRGSDLGNPAAINQTIELLQKAHIALYVVYDRDNADDPFEGSIDRLRRVATETNGRLDENYLRRVSELLWGYTIAFPANVTNHRDASRRIRIEMAFKDPQGRTRRDLIVKVSRYEFQ